MRNNTETPINDLITMLHSQSGIERARAAKCLILQGAKVSAHVVEALDSGRTEVRYVATWVLGYIGDEATEEALLTMTHDAEWSVREVAVRALGQFATPQAECAIQQALEDDHKRVRIAARETLDNIHTLEQKTDPLV